jgi:hypothetical protein
MARINWIKGALKGRLGEVVGEQWKGIDYVKTYTKPKDPHTPKQEQVRDLFRHIANICRQIKPALDAYMFPRPTGMTSTNKVIKLNNAMFGLQGEKWQPKELKIFSGNLRAMIAYQPTYNSSLGTVTMSWDNEFMQTVEKVFVILYDDVSGLLTYHDNIDNSDQSTTFDVSAIGGITDPSKVYVYITSYIDNGNGTGENNNTLGFRLSETAEKKDKLEK